MLPLLPGTRVAFEWGTINLWAWDQIGTEDIRSAPCAKIAPGEHCLIIAAVELPTGNHRILFLSASGGLGWLNQSHDVTDEHLTFL